MQVRRPTAVFRFVAQPSDDLAGLDLLTVRNRFRRSVSQMAIKREEPNTLARLMSQDDQVSVIKRSVDLDHALEDEDGSDANDQNSERDAARLTGSSIGSFGRDSFEEDGLFRGSGELDRSFEDKE